MTKMLPATRRNHKEAYMTLVSKIAMIALAAVVAHFTTACGSDDTSLATTTCSLQPSFVDVEKGASYDRLQYKAAISSDCLELVSQNNGGVVYTLEVSGEPVLGGVREASFGGERVELFTQDMVEADLSKGATVIKREYLSGDYSNPARRVWQLPWADAPTEVNVLIDVISGSRTESYPRLVKIEIKSDAR